MIMISEKKVKKSILLFLVMLVACVLGFCIVPFANCFAEKGTLISEGYIAEGDAIFALTDADVACLISGEITLEELASSYNAAKEQSAASAAAMEMSGVVTDSSAETSAVSSEALQETQIEAQDESASSLTVTSAETGAQEETYEAEIKALIQQLYAVKARAESGLNSCISAAKAEYKALPVEQQTKAKKIAICFSKAGQLKSLQASCDAEVESIVSQMRTILAENGQSTALADQAMSTYESQKSARYSQLMSQLYK